MKMILGREIFYSVLVFKSNNLIAMWMKCINVVMCIDKRTKNTSKHKKQSNWMQLLKMENDKLPKEICTYKIKKTHII